MTQPRQQFIQQQRNNYKPVNRIPSWFNIDARQPVPVHNTSDYPPYQARVTIQNGANRQMPDNPLDDFIKTLSTDSSTQAAIGRGPFYDFSASGLGDELVLPFIEMSFSYWDVRLRYLIESSRNVNNSEMGTLGAGDDQDVQNLLIAFEAENPQGQANTNRMKRRVHHVHNLIHGGDFVTDVFLVGSRDLNYTRFESQALTNLLPKMFRRLYYVDMETAVFMLRGALNGKGVHESFKNEILFLNRITFQRNSILFHWRTSVSDRPMKDSTAGCFLRDLYGASNAYRSEWQNLLQEFDDPTAVKGRHFRLIAQAQQDMVDVILKYEGTLAWQAPTMADGQRLPARLFAGFAHNDPRWYTRTNDNQAEPWKSIFSRIGN